MNMLVVTGEGLGNILMATPLIRVLNAFCPNDAIHLYFRSTMPGLDPLFTGKFLASVNDPPATCEILFKTRWGKRMPSIEYRDIIDSAANMPPGRDGHEAVQCAARFLAWRPELRWDDIKPYFRPYIREDIPDHPLIPTQQQSVAIHAGCNPGDTWNSKRYPYYCTVVDELKKLGIVTVGLGRLHSDPHIKNVDIDLYGKTDIMQLAAVMKNCTVFLSNDNGPMHLATTLHKSHVVIVGGAALKKWRKNDPTVYNKPTAVVLAEPILSKLSPNRVVDTVLTTLGSQ